MQRKQMQDKNKRISTPNLIAYARQRARIVRGETVLLVRPELDAIADRLHELRAIIRDAMPIVAAQNGAEHMLDGFSGRKARPSDGLLARMQAEID
jgi:hypothetical protein